MASMRLKSSAFAITGTLIPVYKRTMFNGSKYFESFRRAPAARRKILFLISGLIAAVLMAGMTIHFISSNRIDCYQSTEGNSSSKILKGQLFCYAKFLVGNKTAVFGGLETIGISRLPIIKLTQGCELMTRSKQNESAVEYWLCRCEESLCNDPISYDKFKSNNNSLKASSPDDSLLNFYF
ncbi:unnamed protein product [Caenorhabditis nigoni]